MYFHTDNNDVITTLMHALSVAMVQEKRVRIDVDSEGNLKYKIGEGMWSAPVWSTPDPYRDVEMSHEMAVNAEDVLPDDLLTAFGNARVTGISSYSEFMTELDFEHSRTEKGYVVLSDVATVTVRRKV